MIIIIFVCTSKFIAEEISAYPKASRGNLEQGHREFPFGKSREFTPFKQS